MKNILLINGSPRKSWNTSALLEKAAEGAEAAGARTRTIHLYDLDFKGCRSCFACKHKDGRHYGKCAVPDDLKKVLEEAAESDAIIVGSPIYFGSVSGETQSFMERLLFPYAVYTNPLSSIFGGKTRRAGLLYSMNISTPEAMEASGVAANIRKIEGMYRLVFGYAESLCSLNTTQFDDYDRVVFEYQSVEEKKSSREKDFPEDLRRAFELGKRFAE
jgi:NAD(P)H-dependent FMN reductase